MLVYGCGGPCDARIVDEYIETLVAFADFVEDKVDIVAATDVRYRAGCTRVHLEKSVDQLTRHVANMDLVALRQKALGCAAAYTGRATGNQHDILVICWHSHWEAV